MRSKLVIASVAFAAVVPTMSMAGQPDNGPTVAELRENGECRQMVRDMYQRTVPAQNELLSRDYVLNSRSGTMRTGDVQNIRQQVKEIFNKAKYKMIRSMNADKCKRIANRTVDRINSYIRQNAY